MRPVSDAFRAAVRADHKSVIQCDVLRYGVVIEDSIPIVDGSVTLDRNASIRGQCDLTIPDMVPTTAQSLLAPYGNELAIYRGIDFGPSGQELISLGRFRIDSVESAEPGRSVHVTGQDRSAVVSDARLEALYTVDAGTNYVAAIRALIEAGLSGATVFPFALGSTVHSTPEIIVQEQSDRWDTAQSWAQSCGLELYFDGDGVCVARSEPDITTGPIVFDIDEGPGGILIDVGTTWDRQRIYNRVIAIGENPASGAIYRGVATDSDPSSPTYYFGPFGKVPTFFASPLLATDGQAAAAALTILRRVTGQTQSVKFDAIVAPFLEPGDIVHVTRSTLPINGSPHLIESLSIPLSPTGMMSGTTRTRRAV